jgi:hypothetical protein
MEKFRINSKTAIDEICLDSTPKPNGKQRHITLELSDWDSANKPAIMGGNFTRVSVISHDVRKRVSRFEVEAVQKAEGKTYVWDDSSKSDVMLQITLGEVTNHDGFEHDLLAELLGRSEDPKKLWVYQRLLKADNNKVPVDWHDWDKLLADQPLKQITDPNHPNKWNCGAALDRFGQSYFGKHYSGIKNHRYYKPFRRPKGINKNRVPDIVFDAALVEKGRAAIQNLLKKQNAITVFVAHNDGFLVDPSGVIKPSGDTHYLTIIGCDKDGKKFLVSDPWPGGSRLEYKSGIFGTVNSAFLGLMIYDSAIDQIRTYNQKGRHNYIVLEGP